jgi:chromosome partitioning protein
MILAITNQKGGVGKTTTVMNLGVYLAKKGSKVLLIDIDPQSNLTSGLGMKKCDESGSVLKNNSKESLSVYDVLVNKAPVEAVILSSRFENLDILPSSIELAGAEVEVVNALSRESILKNALKSVYNKYDFILIDCPPSLGLLTVNALVSSDIVLIPVQTEYFALEGLGQLINTIKLIKANLNHNLDIGGVILTMYDTRTNLSKEVASEIREFFGTKVFENIIPRSIRLSEAPSHGLSIWEYDPLSVGAESYDKLAEEIVKRFKATTKMERPQLVKN